MAHSKQQNFQQHLNNRQVFICGSNSGCDALTEYVHCTQCSQEIADCHKLLLFRQIEVEGLESLTVYRSGAWSSSGTDLLLVGPLFRKNVGP